MADPTQLKAKQRILASFEEARSAATFPVKTPGFLPGDLALNRIVYVLPPWVPDDYRGTAGFLDFIFSRPGARLIITQGYTVPYDTRGAPPGKSGEASVNGKPAVWIDGFLTVDEPTPSAGPEDNPTARWQEGQFTLGWHGDGLVSYRLTASGLSLHDLVQIAESLQ